MGSGGIVRASKGGATNRTTPIIGTLLDWSWRCPRGSCLRLAADHLGLLVQRRSRSRLCVSGGGASRGT